MARRGMQKRTIEKLNRYAATANADAAELGLQVSVDEFGLFLLTRDGKRIDTFSTTGGIYTYLQGYRDGFEQAQQERRDLAAKQQS
jgi:hypothetical protein